MRRTLLLTIIAAILATGCENVFTTSPLTFLQRDPSDLSDEQKVTFGENALASGDPEAMAEAFEVLKDSDDPETQLLAADLALGASGLEGAVTETVASLGDGADTNAALDDALADFDDEDFERFQEAADLINAADDSVTPTAEQYAYAAIGMMAVAADAAGGVANVDGSPDPVANAAQAEAEALLQASYDSLIASGESTDLIEQLGDAIGLTFI